MTNKSEPSPLSKLADKALESTVGLFLVFIISTVLIGGMGYILFESRNEELDVAQHFDAITNNIEYDSYARRLMDGFSALYFDETRSNEISNAFHNSLYAQFNSSYVEVASKWCKDTIQKYMRLKSEMDALVLSDQLLVRLQSSIGKLVESKIAVLDLLSNALTNWNKASKTQRVDYYENMTKVYAEVSENALAVKVQASQLTQELDTYTREIEQRVNLATSKLEIWRTRRDLAPIGIGIGLLCLFGLFVLLLYKVRHK